WPIFQAVFCATPIHLAMNTEDMPLLELTIKYMHSSHFHNGNL
ncbi:hypothetical protein D1AOALGA4SA_10460, partial [Olavius algarvensis Delta 1 endosymbiont]